MSLATSISQEMLTEIVTPAGSCRKKYTLAGPSVMLWFYINHEGRPQSGIPLFNEPGVSTVAVDNIPALKFPLLD